MYIVECNDGTLYTGITTNLIRRENEHNGLGSGLSIGKGSGLGIGKGDGRSSGKGNGKNGGASYTRARRPVVLVYHEEQSNRSEASRREWHIKRLSRAAKQRLINGI